MLGRARCVLLIKQIQGTPCRGYCKMPIRTICVGSAVEADVVDERRG
jgi:hypothetical protein